MSVGVEGVPVVLARRGAMWAVLKPAGMAVHQTNDPSIPDLVRWAREGLAEAKGEVAPIHRLDRATSGVVLLSDDPKVRADIGRMFAESAVEKVYLALVAGRSRKKGVVRKALQDGRRGKPLPAVTRYRCLELLGKASLLRVRPETGRKHQIRRHLHHIGLPVVGDERYRAKRRVSVPGFPGRLWLHAQKLTLPDGFVVEAPLPPELEAHLEHLRGILVAASEMDEVVEVDGASQG